MSIPQPFIPRSSSSLTARMKDVKINESECFLPIPQQVGKYIEIESLEPSKNNDNTLSLRQPSYSKVFQNYKTSCYRATAVDDGITYFLRRVHDPPVIDESLSHFVTAWQNMKHAGIAEFIHVFSSEQFELCEYKFFKSKQSISSKSTTTTKRTSPSLINNVSEGEKILIDQSSISNSCKSQITQIGDLEEVSISSATSTSCTNPISNDSSISEDDSEINTLKSRRSLIFVYEYYQNAKTLEEVYFSHLSKSNNTSILSNSTCSSQPVPNSTKTTSSLVSNLRSKANQNSNRNLSKPPTIKEHTLWSYIVQLTSVVRFVHTANYGLVCRTLDPSKILVCENKRLKLSSCCILDLISSHNNHGSNSNKSQLDGEDEDRNLLANLLIRLACSFHNRDVTDADLEYVKKNFSTDTWMVIVNLLNRNPQKGKRPEVSDIMPFIGARFFIELDMAHKDNERLTKEINRQRNNAVLFRVLVKLCSICERPTISGKSVSNYHALPESSTWAETDERYLLKLFRDYVFHSVDEYGRPWLNLHHVISSLNKLCYGCTEKITLTSRDKNNIFVVSYTDIKTALDKSYNELIQQSQKIQTSEEDCQPANFESPKTRIRNSLSANNTLTNGNSASSSSHNIPGTGSTIDGAHSPAIGKIETNTGSNLSSLSSLQNVNRIAVGASTATHTGINEVTGSLTPRSISSVINKDDAAKVSQTNLNVNQSNNLNAGVAGQGALFPQQYQQAVVLNPYVYSQVPIEQPVSTAMTYLDTMPMTQVYYPNYSHLREGF